MLGDAVLDLAVDLARAVPATRPRVTNPPRTNRTLRIRSFRQSSAHWQTAAADQQESLKSSTQEGAIRVSRSPKAPKRATRGELPAPSAIALQPQGASALHSIPSGSLLSRNAVQDIRQTADIRKRPRLAVSGRFHRSKARFRSADLYANASRRRRWLLRPDRRSTSCRPSRLPAAPAPRLVDPSVAAPNPARLHVNMARARPNPSTAHPNVPVASPLIVTFHPNSSRIGSRRTR